MFHKLNWIQRYRIFQKRNILLNNRIHLKNLDEIHTIIIFSRLVSVCINVTVLKIFLFRGVFVLPWNWHGFEWTFHFCRLCVRHLRVMFLININIVYTWNRVDICHSKNEFFTWESVKMSKKFNNNKWIHYAPKQGVKQREAIKPFEQF